MFIQYGQEVNECNGSFDEKEHSPACLGKCKRKKLENIDVDLHNESVRWQQNEMRIAGVPKSLDVPGIGVDILHTDIQLEALIELLGIDEKVLLNKFKEIFLKKLVEIRSMVEAEREATPIVVPGQTILLPNGQKKLH